MEEVVTGTYLVDLFKEKRYSNVLRVLQIPNPTGGGNMTYKYLHTHKVRAYDIFADIKIGSGDNSSNRHAYQLCDSRISELKSPVTLFFACKYPLAREVLSAELKKSKTEVFTSVKRGSSVKDNGYISMKVDLELLKDPTKRDKFFIAMRELARGIAKLNAYPSSEEVLQSNLKRIKRSSKQSADPLWKDNLMKTITEKREYYEKINSKAGKLALMKMKREGLKTYAPKGSMAEKLALQVENKKQMSQILRKHEYYDGSLDMSFTNSKLAKAFEKYNQTCKGKAIDYLSLIEMSGARLSTDGKSKHSVNIKTSGKSELHKDIKSLITSQKQLDTLEKLKAPGGSQQYILVPCSGKDNRKKIAEFMSTKTNAEGRTPLPVQCGGASMGGMGYLKVAITPWQISNEEYLYDLSYTLDQLKRRMEYHKCKPAPEDIERKNEMVDKELKKELAKGNNSNFTGRDLD